MKGIFDFRSLFEKFMKGDQAGVHNDIGNQTRRLGKGSGCFTKKFANGKTAFQARQERIRGWRRAHSREKFVRIMVDQGYTHLLSRHERAVLLNGGRK